MTVDVQSAFGTVIKIGDGETPTEAFTSIPELGDIEGLTKIRNMIEWLAHSSPGGHKQRMAGSKDTDPLSFELGYLPEDSTHIALLAAYESGDPTNFQIVFPDDSGYEFSGTVSNWGWKEPVEGVWTVDVEISINEAPIEIVGS